MNINENVGTDANDGDNAHAGIGGDCTASQDPPAVTRANNSTNDSRLLIGSVSDSDDVPKRRIRPSCITISKKRKQQQNDNLLALTILKSEHFKLEYKLKQTQTEAAVKKVLLEERIVEATVCKMEEDAKSLVMDRRITVIRECDCLKHERGMMCNMRLAKKRRKDASSQD